MNLIKLDAIDSTNVFLKQLLTQQSPPNFTVVCANYQTNGKGQMGSVWDSESGKNLIMSVLVEDVLSNTQEIFTFNKAIALSVLEVLQEFDVPNVSIKWPNDIMSGKYKLGGILIENLIKQNGTISSIVGIGINVNQTNFENLPQASSIINVLNKELSRDELLKKIVFKIKDYSQKIFYLKRDIYENYHKNLFRLGLPTVFEDVSGIKFMGIIKQVSHDGKLVVEVEDGAIHYYDVKEVKMLF